VDVFLAGVTDVSIFSAKGQRSRSPGVKENKSVLHKYTVSGKNLLNIIDCHLKKGYLFFIIFGRNVSGTTGHQMIVQYSTSPSVCFCTT